MRPLATLATLLLGLAIVFWAPAAKADCPHNDDDTHQHCSGGTVPSNEFRFIGFTDDAPVNILPNTIDGGQGMIAMHELCQDDFGPSARMCTSEEFWLSPNAAAPTALSSWLHHVDFIGGGLGACKGWADATSNGLTVDTGGKPFITTCSVSRPVTCCAQIQ